MPSFRKYQRLLVISTLLTLLVLGACLAPPTAYPTQTQPPTVTVINTPFPSPATITAQPSPTHTATALPTPPDVTSFPNPNGYTWSEVASGLTLPIGLTSANDGSGRLFIIEQPGRIKIHDGTGLQETAFLDIRDRVGDKGSEQGLLGLAFHPDYAENGVFFVSYTNKGGDSVISRFLVSSSPDQAEAGSESILLTIPQPYKNHNGGQILFGPQGYLWIAIGDGGSAGDPQGNGQNLNTLLGKLLRIDVSQEPYTIPEDNPFGNEIWAYGLRNPWRFTFDPAYNDLYIADVGQAKWEEVNFLPADAPAGINFGWDYREGNHKYEGTPPEGLPLINPVVEYDHDLGCSVSGGAVYRGSLLEWQGIYLYGDFCSGRVWGLLQTPSGEWLNEPLFQFDSRIAAIDQDEDGEIYLVNLLGTILKLTAQ
jgi:glucose/arabinose dehydrogenase